MEPASFDKGKGTLRTIYKMITILLLKTTKLSGILQSEKRKGGHTECWTTTSWMWTIWSSTVRSRATVSGKLRKEPRRLGVDFFRLFQKSAEKKQTQPFTNAARQETDKIRRFQVLFDIKRAFPARSAQKSSAIYRTCFSARWNKDKK